MPQTQIIFKVCRLLQHQLFLTPINRRSAATPMKLVKVDVKSKLKSFGWNAILLRKATLFKINLSLCSF